MKLELKISITVIKLLIMIFRKIASKTGSTVPEEKLIDEAYYLVKSIESDAAKEAK